MALGQGLQLFPYPPRPPQRDLVELARSTLEAGGHAVVESGTGTGKTVCALTGAIQAALARGKRVLYLVRTNAQERQVMRELAAIRARTGLDFPAAALQGRRHLCPLAEEDEDVARANAEELGVMCRDRCRALSDEREGKKPRVKPCRFYKRTVEGERLTEALAWAREASPAAEELVARAREGGICPYHVTRALLPEARLVVAPYIYFFSPALRRAFLSWTGASAGDFLVVVDEAHNLPDFARDLGSADLGRQTLELAGKEADEFGNPTVLGDLTLKGFLAVLDRLIDEIAVEYVPPGEEDALVPPEELDTELLHAFRAPTPRLDKALLLLGEYGESVREARRRRGKVPRSYVGAVAAFLRFYRQADEATHVRLVRGGDDSRLECYALDPSVVTDVLHETAGSLHMSGTLAPLDEYRDSIGLPRSAPLVQLPSPFPPENRRVVFDTTVTTRFDDVKREPGLWDRLGERLREIRDSTDRNVAVFLPSYDVLHRVAGCLGGRDAVISDVRGAKQEDLMGAVARFKATRGATLLSVMGGRLSEGVDFPEEELEVVVVVGLPYPKPTARQQALVRFYDRRFGRGWDYAVRAPMTRKVLQSVGRLIRTPDDRGIALLLDRRAALLSADLPGLTASADPASEVAEFFNRDSGCHKFL